MYSQTDWTFQESQGFTVIVIRKNWQCSYNIFCIVCPLHRYIWHLKLQMTCQSLHWGLRKVRMEKFLDLTLFQGRTRWRNCRLTTKTPDYQLGWDILVKGWQLLRYSKTLLSVYVVKILQTFQPERTYNLQLGLRQWCAGNVYLLVLSSWKINIAETPIARLGL